MPAMMEFRHIDSIHERYEKKGKVIHKVEKMWQKLQLWNKEIIFATDNIYQHYE